MTVINISPEVLKDRVKQAGKCRDCLAILDDDRYILEFCLDHSFVYEGTDLVITTIECSRKFLFPEDYE